MRMRFQTRMALGASIMTAVTVGILSMVLLTVAIYSATNFYQQRGIMVTRLARRSVEYGLGLPETVMDRVGEQMLVSALLASEFVAVAETEGKLNPGEISDRLRRVIDRSEEVNGYHLVDEFWVTDAEGHAYIGTEDFDYTFPEGGNSQSAPFRRLLEAEAAPITQDLQAREYDGQLYKYVGVSGVDQPRIVQVGVGEDLVTSIESDFLPQYLLEPYITGRFYRHRARRAAQGGEWRGPEGRGPGGDRQRGGGPPPGGPPMDTDITRIAVVDLEGNVLAKAGQPEGAAVAPEVIAFCREFLRGDPRAFEFRKFGEEVGIVTPLRVPRRSQPAALFMQHETEPLLKLLSSRVTFILSTGALLILGAILVSFAMGRRLSRPLLQLSEGAEAFGRGRFDHRIEIKADREFTQLADSFNSMADSVQHYLSELESETARRERLESEMRIAAEMQRALLPENPPVVDGVEVAGFSLAAREVGGDFYDLTSAEEGRLGAVIGDGTDKGLPAAMLITECWSFIGALSEDAETPADLLYRTNNLLHQRIGESGRFVTLFLMALDARARRLRYAVAGHNPPILMGVDLGRCEQLRSTEGLPLGIQADCTFENVDIDLEAGDTILLYSDGITEAFAPDGSLYGDARLRDVMRAAMDLPLSEMLNTIRRDVETFTHGAEPADDMTLVAVRLSQ